MFCPEKIDGHLQAAGEGEVSDLNMDATQLFGTALAPLSRPEEGFEDIGDFEEQPRSPPAKRARGRARGRGRGRGRSASAKGRPSSGRADTSEAAPEGPADETEQAQPVKKLSRRKTAPVKSTPAEAYASSSSLSSSSSSSSSEVAP